MIRICPIAYIPLNAEEKYSKQGLRLLSPKLEVLQDLPFSAEEQRKEAQMRASKMSIQGVQLKLSARLNVKSACFDICDTGGTYILKPQSASYNELPENEDLTMRLASVINIKVPVHGLLYGRDEAFTYFIKRFDRMPKHQKLMVEDFAQLADCNRETKYQFSMEKLIGVIEKYCTFPILEKKELFLRTLFHFLTGNEDMHLKNFSLITQDQKTTLAPAYDFVNSTIALPRAKEELALPLNGKKNNLTKKDFINYYAKQRLGLSAVVIENILKDIQVAIPKWQELIKISFLSEASKERYSNLLSSRMNILFG